MFDRSACARARIATDEGEVPVGFVQIKPGHEVAEQELSEFCRERLASYKVPRIWRFVDQFPQSKGQRA
jgi:fatty-acyl-CoA synthase